MHRTGGIDGYEADAAWQGGQWAREAGEGGRSEAFRAENDCGIGWVHDDEPCGLYRFCRPSAASRISPAVVNASVISPQINRRIRPPATGATERRGTIPWRDGCRPPLCRADRAVRGAWLVALAVAWLAAGGRVARAQEDAVVLPFSGPIASDAVLPELVLGEEIVAGPGEPPPGGLSPMVRDGGLVSPELVDDVSAGFSDGLRIQEFALDEMPTDASSGDWFSSGRWYGSAEVLSMSRGRNYRRVVGYDPSVRRNPSGGTNFAGTFMSPGIPFNVVPAARLTLGRSLGRDYLDRDQSLELTYYGGMSFFIRDAYHALPQSFLVTPLAGTIAPGLAGFTGADTYQSTYNSMYNGLELNWKLNRRLGRDQLIMAPDGGWARHAERGWLPALLIGGRVANVDEAFTLTSTRNNTAVDQFSGAYDIQSQTWLVGLNVGGELISQNEFYYWGLRGRVTPAISFAGNQQAAAGVNTLPAPPPATDVARGSFAWRQSANQVGPGFIGDLTLLAGWQVTPNFAIQAGYDFLWVAGVATATRQFNLDNVRPNSIDSGGQILFQGVSMGVEGSW